MADKKVGTKTGKSTQAGRDVYKTEDGENVSEKSTTFKYKGQWINVPSIHKGYQYDDDILRMMLDAEVISPTSTHKSESDAVKAAVERSKSLKFNEGGDVKAFGDLEFEATLAPLLKKDPIAMLGLKVSRARQYGENTIKPETIKKLPEGITKVRYNTSENKQSFSDRSPASYNNRNEIVSYGPRHGASLDVIIHELRHRGLKILAERYGDEEEFLSKYGADSLKLLGISKEEGSNNRQNEFVTELYDDPKAVYVAPNPTGNNTTEKMSDTIQFADPLSASQPVPDGLDSIRDLLDLSDEDYKIMRNGSFSREFMPEENVKKGKSGLDQAAIDLLNDVGVLGFNEGGDVAAQTEEAQGGVVNDMNRQMNLFARGGLGDDGMSRDPVSGNEIPPGSMAEEVRDDIPAQLSEGEYVVPADVVRFFGVKYFEDLRQEAKMGLSNMEANGRIGGEPIEPQMAQAGSSPEITDQDLAQLEQMLSTGVANGGLMDKLVFAAKNDRVINQRLNAGGVVVGYAGGGQVAAPTASYADPNRVDAVISQVMTAVQQKPELLQELSKRGIQVSRTNPNMQPQQMNQANPPQEATKAFALGGFNTPGDAGQAVNPSTGLPSWAGTPGGSYTYQGPGVPAAPVTSVAPVAPVGAVTAAPASTAQEACTAMGMGYDPITGTCILVNKDGNGGTIAPEAKEFKWEEPDVNYFEMSEEELAAIGTGAKIDPFLNKLALGAAVVAGPLGLIIGGYSAYQQGKAISEVRSAALVAKARGLDDLADTLNKQADTLVDKSGFLVQGANTFGGLSGINDFSQQIAAFSPKDFNVGLNLKMFDGDEKAYLAAIRGADEAISKRGVSTAKEQRARLSDPVKLKEARDKAAAYKAEMANKKSTVSATTNPYSGSSNNNNNNNNNNDGPAFGSEAWKKETYGTYQPVGTTTTTDPSGSSVTETTYTNAETGDTFTAGADEDGLYKGGLMKKRKKK